MQGYCGACSCASAMVVHLMPMVESWRLMIWLGEQAFLFGHDEKCDMCQDSYTHEMTCAKTHTHEMKCLID